MEITEFLAALSVEDAVTGALILVVVIAAIIVKRKDSVQYYPGQEIASVAIELGRQMALSFETPDGRLIPPAIAKEMEPGFLWPGYPPCALWYDVYLEEIDRTSGVVPTITMALKIEPAGADVMEHAGFRLGRSLRPGTTGSPFSGDVLPGVGGRMSEGANFFKATALLAPLRLPPRTRVDVTVLVSANENTAVKRLRVFAARPVENGGIPD